VRPLCAIKAFVLVLAFSYLSIQTAFGSQALQDSLRSLAGNPEFVDLSTIPGIVVDLKYATTDNFMKENLYGDFRTAFLHRIAAEKLRVASAALRQLKPGWKLLVFDALRPRSVQRKLWDKVRGTAQQPYVANPEKGSIHNFGFAVDLSLIDEDRKAVDMGSKFDDFSKLSEPGLEEEFLKAGKLNAAQVSNRRILRKVMTEAGFQQQPNEWWHYDALPAREVRVKYSIVE